MNILPSSISRVIESFERLPGIGPKSATRLAFYMLHMPKEDVDRFADSLKNLKTGTVLCSICKHVCEREPCPICSNPSRDHTTICVVEQPTDVLAIEKTGIFHGVYHVLHGLIDPLNNIGPDEIYIADLIKRIRNFGTYSSSPALNGREVQQESNGKFSSDVASDSNNTIGIKEIIFALNSTMESEATIMYIMREVKSQKSKVKNLEDIKMTRLAHGLPIGADIEYADEVTLKRAMEGRREY